MKPEYLVRMYLQYSLIHHEQIVNFEEKVGSKVVEVEKTNPKKNPKVPGHLLNWLKSNGLKPSKNKEEKTNEEY
jgi:hypothetical protein